MKDVAVFGLGKIGLPLAIQIAESEHHKVLGIDLDKTLIGELNSGRVTRVLEPEIEERLAHLLEAGKIEFALPGEIRANVTHVLIAVPVKLMQDETPDFSSLDSVVEEISANMTNTELLLVETTLPIGATRERVKGRLLREGLEPSVVFSPERVSSGRIREDLARYPKIIGCDDTFGLNLAVEFYISFLGLENHFANPKDGVIRFETLEEAEAVKLLETTYRDVNIALANEFSRVVDYFKGNFERVVMAANSQPYSNIHKAGLNVGGHCIPVYPKFLMHSAPFELDLVKLSRLTNQSQPKFMIEKIIEKNGKEVFSDGVLIVGLGYRDWVKESYKSGALEVSEAIREKFGDDLEIGLYDPLFENQEIRKAGFEDISSQFRPRIVIINSSSFEETPQYLKHFLDTCEVIFLGRGMDQRFKNWSDKVILP